MKKLMQGAAILPLLVWSAGAQEPKADAKGAEHAEKAALDAKYVTAMINFVEEEFGVLVSSCEISEDNLGSLRAVARFVEVRRGDGKMGCCHRGWGIGGN